MLVAKIKVSKTTIHTEIVTPITSGMIGAMVEVSFSEDWAGYEKAYVWKHRNRTIDDLDATGIIPHEVLEEYGGVLKFGVYGTKGDMVIPTIYGAIDTVRMGTDPSGDPSVDPSLPVWAQIREEIDDLKQKGVGATPEQVAQIEQNKQDIETLNHEKLSADALPGAINEALAQAKASGDFKGEPGQPGDDYVLTEADKREIAEMAAELVDVPGGGNGAGIIVSETAPEDTSVLWVDTSDNEVPELNIPSDDHINDLINTALGVIENGTY